MKQIVHYSLALLFLLLIIVGCRQHRPYVGEIVVDTDVPNKHNGLLLLGYTLDEGHDIRNLLSKQLIYNGSFDQGLISWESEGIPIAEEKSLDPSGHENIYLKTTVYSDDSIAAIRQPSNSFPVAEGESFEFSIKAYSLGPATLEVRLVEDSLYLPLSKPLTFTTQREWSQFQGSIKTNQDCDRASLQILLKATPREDIQYSDTIVLRKNAAANIYLDDIQLRSPNNATTFGLPSELVSLLMELQPGFLRYPSGKESGRELPIHLDSLLHAEKKPIPSFHHKEFIHLAEKLSAIPILLTNFGYNTKFSYIEQLIKEISNPKVIIQLGYNQDGLEFFYRFHALEQELLEDSLTFHIINSGSILPYTKYSDYPYDRVLSPISFSTLASLDSLISEHDSFAEPQMLGEVYFQDTTTSMYAVPPLVLRASFMTIAERNSPYIEGVGVAPLLSTDLEKDYPLIQVKGSHYEPTPFYTYLKLFSELRGVNLKGLSSHQPFENGLLLSLTADESGENYYLKAVNTTRHPLPYLIKAKGQKSFFSSVTVYSFTPKLPTISSNEEVFSNYEMNSVNIRMGRRQRFDYLFSPYEVVIFQFKQQR